MIARLLLTTSACAVCLAAARADGPRLVSGSVHTEVIMTPRIRLQPPDRPAFSTGFRGLFEEQTSTPATTGVDPIMTGQVPGEHAAPGAAEEHAAPAAGAEAAAAAGGAHEAPAAEHAPPAEGEAKPSKKKKGDEPPLPYVEPPQVTTRGPMPFDIIRTIQFLQDQVARGNGRAIRVQAMLLRRFGPVFLGSEPTVWTDPRNMRAAVLYTLSGGPPEVLQRLMGAGVLDEKAKPLFEGALAYVRNDMPTAEKKLSSIDLSDMEPGLAAHLNLVLGQISEKDRPKDAIAYLDQARLLAPGGLVEEAALRLEVSIAEKLGDHVMADFLSRQYFDRYAKSAYAGNFEARFAAIFSARADKGADAMAKMADIVEGLSGEQKRGIFLAVARRSLVGSRLDLAGLAAKAAADMKDISGPDLQRARLYQTAATLGGPSSAEIGASLAEIDRSGLHPEDAKLFDAANSVLGEIDRRELSASDVSKDPPPDDPAVFSRAKQLLNDIDSDLGKAQP